MRTLEELRARLDVLDRQLLELVAERQTIGTEIAAVKRATGQSTRDFGREREVLLLAAGGHTNREIARTLHLSEQTVHNYRANIMEKLGLHDRMELLKFAIKRGVIEVADL